MSGLAERYGAITSILVSKAGRLVRSDYSDGDADTLRNTRSCTKTVLGMLVGLAIERGCVEHVDVPVFELLERRDTGSAKERITVRELLTMSSCLDCNDWDDASPGNEERMYPERDWLQFALGLPVRSSRGFSYCTAGVVTLGVALERALGEPLSTFAARELFAPLGIERAEWQRTPAGQTSTAGGLELASRSLLSLGELYLRDGGGIIPSGWISESLRPQARIDEQTEYGFLWWLRSFAGEPSFYMTGLGGNRVHVFPGLELVAVITSENFGRPDAHALSDRLLEQEILRQWK